MSKLPAKQGSHPKKVIPRKAKALWPNIFTSARSYSPLREGTSATAFNRKRIQEKKPPSRRSAVELFWGCEDVLIACSLSHSDQSHPLPWQDNSEVSTPSMARTLSDPQHWHHFQPGMSFPWGALTQAPLGFFNLQSSWMWFTEHELQQDAVKHFRSYWYLAASFNNYCLGAQQLLNTIQTDHFFFLSLSLQKQKAIKCSCLPTHYFDFAMV